MMTAEDRLTPSASAALDFSDEDRIRFVQQPRWIGYSRAKEIVACLSAMLSSPVLHRMPNLLVIGETNNGKTMLARRFARLHPREEREDQSLIPVLYIQAPSAPEEGRLYNHILEAINAPYQARDTAAGKEIQVVRLLRALHLRLLIIDEIHDVLAGPLDRQRQFLNVLKYLGNELQISILGLGTVDALRAVATNPQLDNRFRKMALFRWKMDREYLMLLASFQKLLPLRNPFSLTDQSLATTLLAMSEGNIGELHEILKVASERAIRCGREKIDRELLHDLDWVPPSQRAREAARMA
jgi:type II secretory pathway predicted ATPase ExeA